MFFTHTARNEMYPSVSMASEILFFKKSNNTAPDERE